MSREELFDVVIFEIATRRVDSIVGEKLRYDVGHYNAEKRLETAFSRINDRYSAEIVPTGKYKVGDVLEGADA